MATSKSHGRSLETGQVKEDKTRGWAGGGGTVRHTAGRSQGGKEKKALLATWPRLSKSRGAWRPEDA